MPYNSVLSQPGLLKDFHIRAGHAVNPAKPPLHTPVILPKGQKLSTLPEADAAVDATQTLNSVDLDRLLTIQKWARLLDARFTIPGTSIRYGWDSIIGLVPWAGDLLTGLVGAWLVYLAYRVGLPRWLLLQMSANIVLDFAAGSIPVVGDLFDLAFKAHIRNAILVESYVKAQQAQQ